MDITYLGHSSFKIKNRDAAVITDPFDSKMVGLKFAPNEAEIVTISHDHPDHNQSDLVKGTIKVISGPGEYELKGISILGFRTYHDNAKGEERGKNVIYVYEVDGIRICHTGDLGHTLSEELIEEIGDIDILMVNVGAQNAISVEQAVKVVQDIEPAIIIPMHYAEEGINKENFPDIKPVEEFLKQSGLSVERLPKLSIKKEEINKEIQKVIVLEKK